MKVLKDSLKRCKCEKEEKLTEGLIDKIKQIIRDKKSDKQAIDDISDIIEAAPAIWGDDDKPQKQGQKIRVDEALHGNFELETFFKMAKDIGLENFKDLETFLKNEAEPGETEWETMLRYRASLGNDFKIKEELTENKETCVLCGKHIDGYGNNPAPLADEGKCCDSCNSKRVIPARLKAMKVNKMNKNNESLTSLQEWDQFEYDDDYTIDYEDEDEEAIEYDDDYSFRK